MSHSEVNSFLSIVHRKVKFQGLFKLDQNTCSILSKSKNPIDLNWFIKNSYNASFFKKIKNQNCEILVPFNYSNKLYGFIILGRKISKIDYTESDFKLLKLTANIVSSSLKNSFLIKTINKQKKKLNSTLLELETFFDTGKALHESNNDEELYEQILFRSIAQMNVSGGIIYKLRDESPICTVSAILHNKENKIRKELITKNFKPFKECNQINSSLIINDSNDKKIKKFGWNHILVSALKGYKKIYGYLIFGPKESLQGIIPFSPDDVELANIISLQAGIALENKFLIQRLSNEKKSVSNIVRSIGNGIITLDFLGEVKSFNKRTLEILEKPDSELYNHSYHYIFRENPKIIELISKRIKNNDSFTEPNIILNVNGTKKNINLSIRKLIGDDNKLLGTIISLENITKELRIKNTFKRYVSESIVEQIIDNKLDLGMGGSLKHVSILFADIRGFTSMSEKLIPSEIVDLLNSYYTEMIEIIFKNNGTLDKIIGDELMVVFGVPIEMNNTSNKAVKTAMEMQEKLKDFNKKSSVAISIGIGINSGDVISGNIGSEVRSDYTIIGDNVNIAARLCSQANSSEILISDNTYKLITKDFKIKEMVPFKAKGKENYIKNWKVLY